jgi:thioredoxin reductase
MEDIIIIGGGPIGIYAGTLASLHNLKGIIFEAKKTLGGQLSALYPQKAIIDVPGQDSITAQGLIDLLEKQLLDKPNHPEIRTGESVMDFMKKEDGFTVQTNLGSYETKTILIVSGMGNSLPRKMGLAGEDNYKNIMYSIADKKIARGKRVVILGGGDSAVDMANMLAPLASSLAVVHHRNEFRAQSSSVDELKKTQAKLYLPYSPSELIGEGDSLKSLQIKNTETGEEKELPLDLLLVNFGMAPSQNNFPIEKNGINIKVGASYQTSMENVFAIGNTVEYPGKVKNITCGLGEAVVAVTKIDQIVHPGKNIPIHF